MSDEIAFDSSDQSIVSKETMATESTSKSIASTVVSLTTATDEDCDEEVLVREASKIRFDMDRNQTLTFEFDYENIEDQIWFTQDDYIRFKSISREQSRAWRREGWGILIKDSFDSSNPQVQEYLNAFCLLGDDLSRRGLERHLSRQHAEERSDQKDLSRQAVFITQERLGRRGLKHGELSERIAQAYADQCRCAKLFARRIAIADEMAVVKGEDSSLAEKILDKASGGRERKMERRLSNYSAVSANSMDSRRRWAGQHTLGGSQHNKGSRRCPASPATPMEEYYAAIA